MLLRTEKCDLNRCQHLFENVLIAGQPPDYQRGAAECGQEMEHRAHAKQMKIQNGHIVRWAAHESGGLKSLRRSDEGRCIQRRG